MQTTDEHVEQSHAPVVQISQLSQHEGQVVTVRGWLSTTATRRNCNSSSCATARASCRWWPSRTTSRPRRGSASGT